ncbi:MAG: aminotransferase class III-fold pyridoxal phosphate-dependent enzyme [Candidatus Omnitrophica bacterium]|nr:aminotransferase class III-fold pyridoxal phosphate-dependent enzyme [Candidatus Omnitrophota bacterium]MBU4589438.1 aminotransferase class III-fold pyridoxal phosphate-dependent enzyme [Candidatus Omnitrophota bacterium]
MANTLLFKKAEEHLVGGVNSPVRSFNYIGREPILIKKGSGSRIYDYDGNSYIDYVLSYGASILGHAHPGVVKALSSALKNGFSFGATNLKEVELARLIKNAISSIEKLRFVNSGTEATLSATRLARAYTGRNRVLRLKNSYHGHADYLLEEIDKASIEEVFKKSGNKIAAVIVEPVGGNFGVVLPDTDFLKRLRELTKEYGALLIFDEVITGFRFRYGSVSDIIGVNPDLICLGKIIGGGLSIGAYGGGKEIMDNLAPLGTVYQGSTFAGNPIVMQAGIATLEELRSKKYEFLEELAGRLAGAIREEAKKQKIDLEVAHYRTIFSVRFKEKAKFQAFYKKLLKRGVYFAPSENEANFVSFSHTRKDIDNTIKVVTNALGEI